MHSGYPCPPFKLIVLDEADSLTTDAQTALRRIIEVSSKGTRFCIICNYVSRIIDPLTSRCAKFRFKPVNLTDGLSKLEHICKAESVKFVGGDGRLVLERLVEVTGGDLRRAVGLLQSAHQLGRPLRVEDVDEMAGVIPGHFIEEALKIATDPKTAVQVLLDWVNYKIVRAGFPALQFIHQVTGMETTVESIDVFSWRRSWVGVRVCQK